ncbi:hypothetical protein OF897_20430 [Chryseobacterium formosus]|uniref:MORN repeat variant n=1 Tax=Chryseobacterium formosus TaxID=1537363 RepID=A0ABT3XXA3_9FLAO|nr:hypothetical protein [Chryseobacterium formosus]MCX8526288.1 hypothetical protein [Chryseobacterium formosus]
MKYLLTFILSVIWTVSSSQEKILPSDYSNGISSQYCYYTKHNMKPFNGYIKFKDEDTGDFQYSKIENGCNHLINEIFSPENKLLFRGKYTYDKWNNQITSYQNDSVNLGKSEFLDKKITDSKTLVTKRILNYYHSDYENGIEKVIPITGIIYNNDSDEIYSIQYKNGIAIKLITYYDNKDFDSSNTNIPTLKKKESHELLFNENGNIYDTDLSDKKYPFIFTGVYIKWDENGNMKSKKNLSK